MYVDFVQLLGKAVPVKKIGDRNVPLYEPEDTCSGGPELEKYGTLDAKQCSKFMNENPCVREQYWTGIPDHSGDCYKKLYKNAGGRDSKKDSEWWENQENRKYYNMSRQELNVPTQGEFGGISWISTCSLVINSEFKKYADKISDKCYEKANKAWNWLTGYKYDPCVHRR